MSLSAQDFKLIESDYAYARKIRFTLAHLFGLRAPSRLPELLMQGTEAEIEVVLRLLRAFALTKNRNQRLREIAERGLHEYAVEQAFEEGREFALKQPLQMLQAEGLNWRYSKNPYRVGSEQADAAKADAWTDGFKAYFDVVCVESW